MKTRSSAWYFLKRKWSSTGHRPLLSPLQLLADNNLNGGQIGQRQNRAVAMHRQTQEDVHIRAIQEKISVTHSS